MHLPPVIHRGLIDTDDTRGYVPRVIEFVLRFGPDSRWRAGAVVMATKPSQAVATRCALLIPRRGKRSRMLALHPALPAEVVKSMLRAI